MTSDKVNPQELAHEVVLAVADGSEQVGDFVAAIDLGQGVTDFRFSCKMRGYEGWQWAVALYHDEENDEWTVDESALVPTSQSLLAPQWVPWKDRLTPGDLSVTDAVGTDPDDSRMEDGYCSEAMDSGDAGEGNGNSASAASGDKETKGSSAVGDDGEDSCVVGPTDVGSRTTVGDKSALNVPQAEESPLQRRSPDRDGKEPRDADSEDCEEAVEALLLSRRHVLSPLGRSQTANRWYRGQHGPKSLSTKTSDGNPCSTCAFFVPLIGELGTLFGVCANKWSADDGRVVSMDHGCGEHSEIEQRQVPRLWVQTEPAYDDVHIDVIEKTRKNHHAQVELLERVVEDDTETH